MSIKMHYLYLLVSKGSGSKYVGSTNHLQRRLTEHNSGHTQSTKHQSDWYIAYWEEFPDSKSARATEMRIKRNKKYRLEFYNKAGF